jgi:hypothetical protein
MLTSKLIDDLLVRVKAISDDAYLDREQAQHFLMITRDMLVKDYLDGLINKGKAVDPFYIERETCKSLQEEDEDCVGDCDERLFILLENEPMSLFDDKGVLVVTTYDGVVVLKARVDSLSWIKDLPYSKPTQKNPIYYREGKKIVIDGISRKNKTITFIVSYIPSYGSQDLSEDSEFKIHDALIPVLMDMVEQTARRELGFPEDMENDGTDIKQPTQ